MRQAERNGCAVRFCSNACYVKTGDKNPFFGGKHKAESIKKMKEHPNRSSFKPGPDNPNFVRFGADYKPRTSVHLRGKLIERAGGKCERCAHDCTGILQIHHVDRDRRHNAMSNLLLLCPNCHALDHYVANDGLFNRLVKRSFP